MTCTVRGVILGWADKGGKLDGEAFRRPDLREREINGVGRLHLAQGRDR
jgi:hypothetical protein